MAFHGKVLLLWYCRYRIASAFNAADVVMYNNLLVLISCHYGLLCPDMPSPVSPVSPMYYVGPPPPPEALRGMAFAPHMVGPPAYPYFQPPAEPEPEPEPEAEPDSEAKGQKLQNQFEFYFRLLN